MLITLLALVWFSGLWLISPRYYSDNNSEELFEKIFGTPIYKGITYVRAGGVLSVGGGFVWMRFNTTPEAMHNIIVVSNAQPASKEIFSAQIMLLTNAKSLQEYFIRKEDDYIMEKLRQDALRMHWNEVLNIQSLEYYIFNTSSTWSGVMAFDRQRQNVFVLAEAR